jgi:hypothetical protein
MSFWRHGQIYQSDGLTASDQRRSRLRLRLWSHRLDEFAASYSLVGCTPAEPASASPAGSIFIPPAEFVNYHEGGAFFDWQNGYFSTGIDR